MIVRKKVKIVTAFILIIKKAPSNSQLLGAFIKLLYVNLFVL